MKKQQILITGGAGMIGSSIVRHLNDLGIGNLILVDDLKHSSKWENLVGKQFSQLISKHRLFDWLKGREELIDAVIHLGACSSTTETDGDYLIENNYRFTIRLAEWALHAGKRFIYASSAATYGNGSEGFLDDEDALQRLRPLNRYGYTKHLVDLWMKEEGAFKQVVGLKYFNVFGPNEYHKGAMASMILKMHKRVREEGVLQLYRSNEARFADGEQCRDFIYVKDAVKMTCQFLWHPKVAGLFNIGQGETTTWNQIARELFAALGKEPRIEYIDMPDELKGQYQNYTCADMRRFQGGFPTQFTPTPIGAAVKEYVQEYLENNARW